MELLDDEKKLLDVLNDYYGKEFDYEKKDSLDIIETLAYTVTDNQTMEVQVDINVEKKTVCEWIDSDLWNETKFDSLEEIAAYIEGAEFGDIVRDVLIEANEREEKKALTKER